MVKSLQGAIPGQSLTDTPRNYPWERPPETAEPNEALMYHLERITQPDVLDNILFAVEYGMPTKHLADLIVTGGVANGVHSVDVSLIITPVIQEYLNATAKQAGIPYKEEFSKAEERKADVKTKALTLLRKSMRENADKDAGAEFLEEVTEMSSDTPDVNEEMEQEEETMMPEPMAPKGLMARG